MKALAENIFSGSSEMAQRMREFDWAKTPLGPVETWPQSLITAVGIMLTSRQPIWLGWGRELIKLYNDPYKAIVGGKHPAALGQPAAVVWREIWTEIGPMLETAMGGGEGTYVEQQLLIMERNGYQEETYYTFSYSPIPDDTGKTGGIICANTEDTPRVIGERQLALLRELAAKTADARSIDRACELSMQCMGTNPRDLPFAMIYLLDADSQQLVLCGEPWDIVRGHPAAPANVQLNDTSSWPFAEVLKTNQAVIVSDLARFRDLPTGDWDRPPDFAVVLPIGAPAREGKAGMLVVGLNPYRLFDESYRGFLELVAAQIAASIGNAMAYEEARKRAEALAEIDRAKTAFFSNVSHEFRTPLTLMLGPLEDALAEVSNISAKTREQLEIAQRNGTRLLKLVNTLLDFSRIEAGRADVSFEPMDLAAFTKDLASIFRSAVEKAGMKLIVDCPPLKQPIYVDREMWEKIILNLISNAFKFTLDGEIEVRLRQEGSTVELSVRDTGTGIPDQELPHVFERFHRVKGAKGRTIEGTGIGLSLVRELVRLHGGEVHVSSKLNEGSTFTISLPVGTAHLPADHIGKPRSGFSTALGADAYILEALRWVPAPNDGGHEPVSETEPIDSLAGVEFEEGAETQRVSRILLADDNTDMREYVRRLLTESYEVVAVADGEAALEAARSQRFDLVLTDVMMPKVDGFAVLHDLRANRRTATIPVILLSARAGEEARIEGLNRGADDYLVKPFSARELLARVSARLEIARLQRENEQRVLNILESLNDGFQAIDANGRFTYANAAAKRIWAEQGINTDVIGKHIFDVFPEVRDSHFGTAFTRVMSDREPIEVESFYAPFQRWYNMRFYPAQEGGLSVFFQDISDRHRAELERSEALKNERIARRQAEEASRLKDEFLATVSHELRTPLNHILGWAVLMRSQRLSATREKEALATIERNARAQNRLIEDLLDVSRIITGKLKLELQPVSITEIVQSAIDSARPVAQAKGVHLVSDFESSIGVVNGDSGRLQQVVWNLLSNAIKFTPEAGTVIVRLAQNPVQVMLSVSDTGEGISQEFLPHVFNRFTQADGSSTRKHSGLGLGLAIVRHLVELHGGKVSVESAGVGCGATFRVILPLRKAVPTPDAPSGDGRPATRVLASAIPTASPPRLDGVKALIVDDEKDTQEIVAALLADCGVQVRTACSASEAMSVLSQWTPDIILADIGMPDEDGYSFMRRVRNNEVSNARATTPAVALTAYARTEDRLNALAAGYQQHLPKPIEPLELWMVVSSLTHRLNSTGSD
jgi:PAS domain S-box-containing protein